ncbi:MAG TPA: hypothetical protein VD907_04445 [Verrucomicrobiae bacterium]|nr:hypothetical protein [Verrucomicrobiae bacterium]
MNVPIIGSATILSLPLAFILMGASGCHIAAYHVDGKRLSLSKVARNCGQGSVLFMVSLSLLAVQAGGASSVQVRMPLMHLLLVAALLFFALLELVKAWRRAERTQVVRAGMTAAILTTLLGDVGYTFLTSEWRLVSLIGWCAVAVVIAACFWMIEQAAQMKAPAAPMTSLQLLGTDESYAGAVYVVAPGSAHPTVLRT